MIKVQRFSTTLCFLVFTTAILGQQAKSPVHSGTWWKDKSTQYKEAFVNGYKSGVRHTLNRESDLSPFGVSELVAGLDTFYKDFRNRNIQFNDAIVFVGEQLHGLPDDKLNAELLKLRAAAANPTAED